MDSWPQSLPSCLWRACRTPLEGAAWNGSWQKLRRPDCLGAASPVRTNREHSTTPPKSSPKSADPAMRRAPRSKNLFQKVSGIGFPNLPYRRFPIGRARPSALAWDHSARPQAGSTAIQQVWKPALRLCQRPCHASKKIRKSLTLPPSSGIHPVNTL